MIGRGAMNNPVMLWDVDRTIYSDTTKPQITTRRQILDAYQTYLEERYPEGEEERSVGAVHLATKPTLGLFAGRPGNKAFRCAMDALMRVKENRALGPGHVLAEAVRKLDESNPGLLDETLPTTEAFKPSKSNGPRNDGAVETVRQGKKRKNSNAGDT